MSSVSPAYVAIDVLTCPNGHTNRNCDASMYPVIYLDYGAIRRKIGIGDDQKLIEKYALGTKITYLAHCLECNIVFMPSAYTEDEIVNCHCLECEIRRVTMGRSLLDQAWEKMAPASIERARAKVPLCGPLSGKHKIGLEKYRQLIGKGIPVNSVKGRRELLSDLSREDV